VLVDISEDTNVDPTYYIVPTSVIDRWLKDNFDAWITTPVAEGQQRAKDNRQRIIHIDGNSTRLSYGYRQKLIPYKEAWDTLGHGSTQGRLGSKRGLGMLKPSVGFLVSRHQYSSAQILAGRTLAAWLVMMKPMGGIAARKSIASPTPALGHN